MLNNPNEWHNIEEETESDASQSITESSDVKPQNFIKDNIKNIKIALLVIAVLFIGVLAVFKKIQSDKAQTDVSLQNSDQLAQSFYDKASGGSSDEPVAVVDVNLGDTPGTPVQAGPPTTVAPVIPLSAQKPNGDFVIEAKAITPTDKYNFNKSLKPVSNKETVIVSVGNEGRINPFLPFREKKSPNSGGGYNNVNFDIIEPPTTFLPDPKAIQLMETTISGIMYDYRNPSAIVNINGQDQLVRKRDQLNGFTILDITRDKVVIKSGTNIYRASVGQSITTEDVNFNNVSNLNHKFGGSYRPASKNSIVIKSN